MERFNIEDAERACKRLCIMVGHPYKHRRTSYREFVPGDWFLTRPGGGGTNAVRVAEYREHGEGSPMGGACYTYREFVAMVSFMTNALSNCWVVKGEGARGYPVGVFEPVPDEDLGPALENFYDDRPGYEQWRVVRPLKIEQED